MNAPASPEKPRTVAIVQARLGSTRLPGKVLQPLAGHLVLEHVLMRCAAVPSVDAVVCATTDLDEDKVVADAAERAGVQVFRGDPANVLSRYAGAARAAHADVILRVTSDCPLIDPMICDRTIRLRAAAGAGYAANNMPRLYPHGLDCEVFTRECLEAADRAAVLDYDREHVTPWMRRSAGVTRAGLIGPGWPSVLQRWTLDYPEDYAFFAALFPLLPRDQIAGTEVVLALLAGRPDIARINAHRRIGGPAGKPTTLPAAIFRFEADVKTGLGHAMRCNALATLLEHLGWRCYWAVSARSAAFLADNAPSGALIILDSDDANAQTQQIRAACGSCRLLVTDFYGATPAFEAEMRKIGALVVTFDDLANRRYDADIIVNPTPGVGGSAYAGKSAASARLLTGPAYALLRSQFAARRRDALARQGKGSVPKRILVAFGGTDPLNGTSLALDVLKRFDLERIDVMLGAKAIHLEDVKRQIDGFAGRASLQVNVAEVAELMAGADLAIGAPGTGAWERACLGLPSLLVGIAENQRANAESLATEGAALISGFVTIESRAQVAARLRNDLQRVIGDPSLCRQLREAAARLCDGRGVQRLAAALIQGPRIKDGNPLAIRLAEISDAEMLYRWQQAPETRRYAVDKAPFSFDQHVAWLTDKLTNPRDWLLIAEISGTAGGTAAGFLRLGWFGEDKGRIQYLISIAAAPECHGRGVGRALLEAARQLVPEGHFYAKVLAENVASHALFRGSGYLPGDDGYYHSTHEAELARP